MIIIITRQDFTCRLCVEKISHYCLGMIYSSYLTRTQAKRLELLQSMFFNSKKQNAFKASGHSFSTYIKFFRKTNISYPLTQTRT